jgi:hypothetical protein
MGRDEAQGYLERGQEVAVKFSPTIRMATIIGLRRVLRNGQISTLARVKFRQPMRGGSDESEVVLNRVMSLNKALGRLV